METYTQEIVRIFSGIVSTNIYKNEILIWASDILLTFILKLYPWQGNKSWSLKGGVEIWGREGVVIVAVGLLEVVRQ